MAIVRLSTPADRDAILAFIARMGFNPRDAVTWDGLEMVAMTAWNNDQLIGAIPMEPRMLRLGPDRVIQAAHETVVAVDPQYRAAGVGSALQQAIAQRHPCGAELLTVFREEPQSPAYRWYLKNGFSPAMRIDSWLCDDPARLAAKAGRFNTWQTSDTSIPWAQIERARLNSPSASCGGGIDRASRDLPAWLATHPYRMRYAFHFIADAMAGYALVGVGKMHSETVRADVLAMMPNSDEPSAFESLLNAVGAGASEKKWRPVRLPLAETDAHVPLLKSRGFTSQWSFDMLTRPLTNIQISQEMIASWRYSGIDYA